MCDAAIDHIKYDHAALRFEDNILVASTIAAVRLRQSVKRRAEVVATPTSLHYFEPRNLICQRLSHRSHKELYQLICQSGQSVFE